MKLKILPKVAKTTWQLASADLPPRLLIVPLISSLWSSPTLELLKLCPISGPANVRQTWNLLPQESQYRLLREAVPNHPLGSLFSQFPSTALNIIRNFQIVSVFVNHFPSYISCETLEGSSGAREMD